MYIRPAEISAHTRISRSPSPGFSPSPPEPEPIIPPLHSGYYMLSLRILPKDWRFGWIIGSGRADKPSLGVDLLVTSNPSRDRVKGRHALLKIDRKTRVLVLQNKSNRPDAEVTLNGQKVGSSWNAIIICKAISWHRKSSIFLGIRRRFSKREVNTKRCWRTSLKALVMPTSPAFQQSARLHRAYTLMSVTTGFKHHKRMDLMAPLCRPSDYVL